MKILAADDSPTTRFTVCRALLGMGYEVEEACDGQEALEKMTAPDAPNIAVLDWLMPGLDGPEVCAAVRKLSFPIEPYLILLTTKCSKEDLIEGLGKGADEFIMKPFMEEELRARLRVGERLVEMQKSLVERVRALEDAMGHISLQARVKVAHALVARARLFGLTEQLQRSWGEDESVLSPPRTEHGPDWGAFFRAVDPFLEEDSVAPQRLGTVWGLPAS